MVNSVAILNEGHMSEGKVAKATFMVVSLD